MSKSRSKLRMLLFERGLAYKELAHEVGLSTATIHRAVHGYMPGKTRTKIAKALKVKEEDI